MGEHSEQQDPPGLTYNETTTNSAPGYTGLAPGVSAGQIATVPTTDATGTPTKVPQNKVVAFVTSSIGLTVLGVIITAATGVDVDPTTLAAIVGAVVTGVGGLAGYLTRNRTSAN